MLIYCILHNTHADVQTSASIYGQFAGVLYKEEEIPEEWFARLAQREAIAAMAEGLAPGGMDRTG
jgi:ADP-ribosylglycohydrolase